MLKVRIIPTLLYKDRGLVKGISFDSWRPVGSLMQAVKVYNMREVDELALLDITATNENRSPDFELVDDIADECFMPFSVGGGVSSLSDVRHLLEVGADKIIINSYAYRNPVIITQIANKFGSQCIIVSIDAKRKDDNFRMYTNSGIVEVDANLIEYAKKVEKLGAGEILLTSIDFDGTMRGYDIKLIKAVSDSVSIPVIASGGAGSYNHMAKAIQQGHASAVAAASIFHFTQQTPLEAKIYLKKHGIRTRI